MARSIRAGNRWILYGSIVLMAMLGGYNSYLFTAKANPSNRGVKLDAIAFSADGTYLASSLRRTEPFTNLDRLDAWVTGRKATKRTTYEVHVRDVSKGLVIASLGEFGYPVFSLTFSPDGKTLVTGGYGAFQVWDALTWQQQAIDIGEKEKARIVSVAFSPDGSTLITASESSVRLWETKSYRLRGVASDPACWIDAASLSPDGKVLATSGSCSIALWESETSERPLHLSQRQIGFLACAYSPDGKILASGSTDNRVTLWDLTTGQQRANFAGHTDWVRSVAFSRDGRILASASQDGMIKLWDVGMFREIRSLEGQAGDANPLAMTPDGKALAFVNPDGTISLGDLDSGSRRVLLPGR